MSTVFINTGEEYQSYPDGYGFYHPLSDAYDLYDSLDDIMYQLFGLKVYTYRFNEPSITTIRPTIVFSDNGKSFRYYNNYYRNYIEVS